MYIRAYNNTRVIHLLLVDSYNWSLQPKFFVRLKTINRIYEILNINLNKNIKKCLEDYFFKCLNATFPNIITSIKIYKKRLSN